MSDLPEVVSGPNAAAPDVSGPNVSGPNVSGPVSPALVASAIGRALAARARGALAEADAAAAEAAAAAPGDPRVWVLLGSLAHLRGALTDAADAYRRALAVAPADAAAHAALAVALTQGGQFAAARDHFAAASAAPLGLWSGLRTLRQARAVARAIDAAEAGWNACATPLFEVEHGASAALERARALAPGRVSWTVDDLRAALRGGPRIAALTGAGISAASGLQTRKQLWQQFSRDEAVSAVRFHADPRGLWAVIAEFWGDRTPTPNAAHHAVARLPGLVGVVTQNVDGLHQAAAVSSAPVLELHGSLLRTCCSACAAIGPPAPGLARDPERLPPACACGGRLRPDVVLFGERVPARVLAEAAALVTRVDLLLVIGCAMDVSPASELPVLAALAGAQVVEIKRAPSRLSEVVPVHHVAGAAEDVLPALLA